MFLYWVIALAYKGDVVKVNRINSVPVGEALLGRAVDALGEPIDGLGKIESTNNQPVEIKSSA